MQLRKIYLYLFLCIFLGANGSLASETAEQSLVLEQVPYAKVSLFKLNYGWKTIQRLYPKAEKQQSWAKFRKNQGEIA